MKNMLSGIKRDTESHHRGLNALVHPTKHKATCPTIKDQNAIGLQVTRALSMIRLCFECSSNAVPLVQLISDKLATANALYTGQVFILHDILPGSIETFLPKELLK
jgi:hypothetical protein